MSEARCASLIELKLRSCAELTDAGVLAVSGLSRLTSLDLTGCSKVTDTGLQAVAALTALAELSLGQCFRVTDGGLRAVSASPTLTSLDLTNCSKMGDVAGMRVLGTLPALTVRDPPHPAVGRKGRKRERDNRGACATFWMAHTLFLLHSSWCFLRCALSPSTRSPSARHADAHWCWWQVLTLNGCRHVTDDGLRELRSLPLRELHLKGCVHVTDEGLRAGVAAMTNLRVLNLRSCTKVTDEGLAAIAERLVLLREVDVSNRAVTARGSKGSRVEESVLAFGDGVQVRR